jgi:hypothetical protein
MRTVGIAFVIVLTVAATARGGGRRYVRCCVDLRIPDVQGPVCTEVRGARRIGPRLACRLIGGKPMGRGDCSTAVCRPALRAGRRDRSS